MRYDMAAIQNWISSSSVTGAAGSSAGLLLSCCARLATLIQYFDVALGSPGGRSLTISIRVQSLPSTLPPIGAPRCFLSLLPKALALIVGLDARLTRSGNRNS